jgi:hypothetical protein
VKEAAMNDAISRSPARQSLFVTVLGWILVVLSGMASVMGLFQNIFIFLAMRHAEIREASRAIRGPEGAPVVVRWAFQYMDWFFLAALVVSLTTLSASIGLLRRRNWARRLLMGLFGLGILYQAFGVAFLALYPFGDVHPEMAGMFLGIRVMTVAMAVIVSVLFGWLIHKLASPGIRAEFGG